MLRPLVWTGLSCGLLLLVGCRSNPSEAPTQGAAPQPVVDLVVTVPAIVVTARAGAVDGTDQNSDEFLWGKLTAFAVPVSGNQPSPVLFETWASDAQTFAENPVWPAADTPKVFQASVLRSMTTPHGALDVPCATPGNAASGGFPTSGTPTPCIAEEVKRNKPEFDYIVSNGLNTVAGLMVAFKKNFDVVMPDDALSVKGDWVPVETLLQWIPELRSVENIRVQYYTNTSESVEYAMVALHISSRQNTNWVWGTIEHQMNPGRCDDLGCYDTFGAVKSEVPPNRTVVNTQYGDCEKSEALEAMMATANLAPAWRNYCMKSTQVDYLAADGTPTALGNSVTERIVGNGSVVASSCIACHAYASFDETGQTNAAAIAMLPYNPTGVPIPAALEGSLKFDFSWGVLNAWRPPNH
ncbi:MAG: hypothetical protein JKY37_30100 [Nannocystaceae bacterium]|nr:hypothetical protein [Nannocystaceae bacterium]